MIPRAKIRKAIQDSIVHWYLNLTGLLGGDKEIVKDTRAFCPLCLLLDNRCVECPVAWVSHRSDCAGTPWQRAHIEILAWILGESKTAAKAVRATARQIQFLESLEERLWPKSR